jgi:hypothetical protein
MTTEARDVESMSTVLLVTTAERMCASIQNWLDMTTDERAVQKTPGSASPNTFVGGIQLPLAVSFLREIHKRGIETGWEWLVEEFDLAMEEKAS